MDSTTVVLSNERIDDNDEYVVAQNMMASPPSIPFSIEGYSCVVTFHTENTNSIKTARDAFKNDAIKQDGLLINLYGNNHSLVILLSESSDHGGDNFYDYNVFLYAKNNESTDDSAIDEVVKVFLSFIDSKHKNHEECVINMNPHHAAGNAFSKKLKAAYGN